jgi:hypothetical protein
MSEWVNFRTLAAFILGVMLSAFIRSLASQAQAKLGGSSS